MFSLFLSFSGQVIVYIQLVEVLLHVVEGAGGLHHTGLVLPDPGQHGHLSHITRDLEANGATPPSVASPPLGRRSSSGA